MKRYMLWRIIGNDLPPRHSETQSVDMLQFILEHEEQFEDCEKGFVFNRIIDKDILRIMREMVCNAGWTSIVIPFELSQFRQCVNDPQKKHYLTNVNLARNTALRGGQQYEYILPFDGGCYFHKQGWADLDTNIRINPNRAFFVTPMGRAATYDEVLSDLPQPRIREVYKIGDYEVCGSVEPQLIFGPGADIEFDADIEYGSADKAELLWKLGIPGPWDRWNPCERRIAIENASTHYGTVLQAGWVFRLPSGNPAADGDNAIRGDTRKEGVTQLLKRACACMG